MTNHRTARMPIAVLLATTLALCATSVGPARAADDKAAAKAARRQQMQMQALQQQVQEAQAAKTKVETDKAEVDKQLADQTAQAAAAKGSAAKLSGSLKAAEGARAQLTATVASLEKQLAEQKRRHDDALAAKARELVQFTRLGESQQALLQAKLEHQVAQVGECTAKNTKLIHLSAELLDRYRSKTVGDVMKQREPLLGMGDVQMFNLVQDYRDRADAERYTAVGPQDVTARGAPPASQAPQSSSQTSPQAPATAAAAAAVSASPPTATPLPAPIPVP